MDGAAKVAIACTSISLKTTPAKVSKFDVYVSYEAFLVYISLALAPPGGNSQNISHFIFVTLYPEWLVSSYIHTTFSNTRSVNLYVNVRKHFFKTLTHTRRYTRFHDCLQAHRTKMWQLNAHWKSNQVELRPVRDSLQCQSFEKERWRRNE